MRGSGFIVNLTHGDVAKIGVKRDGVSLRTEFDLFQSSFSSDDGESFHHLPTDSQLSVARKNCDSANVSVRE